MFAKVVPNGKLFNINIYDGEEIIESIPNIRKGNIIASIENAGYAPTSHNKGDGWNVINFRIPTVDIPPYLLEDEESDIFWLNQIFQSKVRQLRFRLKAGLPVGEFISDLIKYETEIKEYLHTMV